MMFFRPDETFQSSVKGVTLNKLYSIGFKPVLQIWIRIRIQLDLDFFGSPRSGSEKILDLDPDSLSTKRPLYFKFFSLYKIV